MSEQTNTVENPTKGGEPADLGDAGKKAIAAEREARKQAEAAAAEYKKQLDQIEQEKLSDLEKVRIAAEGATAEVEQLKAQLAARELELSRQKVGAEFSLPAELIARLQGEDEASLREDAKSLAGFVSDNSPFPKADPSQGARGSAVGGTNADRFASFIGSKLK